MKFSRKGDKAQYDFRDKLCIGLECWAAGMYQHRSPMSCGGSRTLEVQIHLCCLNRAYRGCPNPLPEFKPWIWRRNVKRMGGRRGL